MPPDLTVFEPIGRAIAALLQPHAEVVLHDLRTGRIAAIWNAVSGRRVGDDSLLDDDLEGAGPTWGPYLKAGLRGERVKSVTAGLRHSDGTLFALLCVNLDVSRLDDARRILASLSEALEPQPRELFGRDWREQMQTSAQAWLQARGLAVLGLTREERVALVGALDAEGLFAVRHAADHAAQMLGVSRSSLYGLLRAARAGGAPS